MKKIILLLGVVLCGNLAIAQNEKPEKTAPLYKNEIGVDVTGTIRYLLNSESTNPTYVLTYRHKFKAGNIRLGLGGAFSRDEMLNLDVTPNTTDIQTNSSANLRIGWEFVTDLGKRSQIFYGVDFRPSMSLSCFKDHSISSISPEFSYYDIQKRTNLSYGIAPFFGYRFKATDRISITSELSLVGFITNRYSRSYMEIISPNNEILNETKQPVTNSFGVNFKQPISIAVTFDL